jgi:hypothetical protein
MGGNFVGYQNPNYGYQRGGVKSLVQKALLTAATNVGEGLIPQHLEKLITNTIVRLAPEIAMITAQYDAQKYHEFNRLTALPAPNGAIGEAGVTPTLRSTYQRTGRILKVLRRKGAVTNFLQDASKNYIDAAAIEMENHIQAHVYDLVTLLLYGNDQADGFTFPGLDTLITTNRVNNAIGGVVPSDLSFLDNLIDQNILRQGAGHRRVILMSPQMLSKVSRLLTNVRLNQGLAAGGLSTVEIPGGWRLSGYRDIPIISSTQCRPTASMGTVTPSTATTGGTVPASYFDFYVSYVDWGGESLACAEVNQQTTGSTSTITLTWTAVSTAFYYKIYVSKSVTSFALASGLEYLRCVLPSNQYDSNGTPTAGATTTVTFSTDPTVVNPTISAPAALVTVTASVQTTGAALDQPLIQTAAMIAAGSAPPENVFFWDLDEIQGMGKVAYTNAAGSRFNGLVTMEPLAKTDDNLPFMIKSYLTLIDSWEATCGLVRNLRVA